MLPAELSVARGRGRFEIHIPVDGWRGEGVKGVPGVPGVTREWGGGERQRGRGVPGDPGGSREWGGEREMGRGDPEGRGKEKRGFCGC